MNDCVLTRYTYTICHVVHLAHNRIYQFGSLLDQKAHLGFVIFSVMSPCMYSALYNSFYDSVHFFDNFTLIFDVIVNLVVVFANSQCSDVSHMYSRSSTSFVPAYTVIFPSVLVSSTRSPVQARVPNFFVSSWKMVCVLASPVPVVLVPLVSLFLLLSAPFFTLLTHRLPNILGLMKLF